MTNRANRSLAAVTILVAGALLCLMIAPAGAQRRFGMERSSFRYTSPSSVLRGQLALEHEDLLKRGTYEPGRYDDATRKAIRDFQWRHHLYQSGWFDYDTYALLPIDERPDADKDGIADADDHCPSTKKGTRVGFDGCPLKKKDGKGDHKG